MTFSEINFGDPDPYGVGPPGSVIILYGSGSFHQKAKKARKTLIPTILCLLFGFLSMETDVNVPRKGNRQKTF
jgi:hypothetical protein